MQGAFLRLGDAEDRAHALTDLQGIGAEDLVNILVQIAADNYVEAAALSEMIARGTRECEE